MIEGIAVGDLHFDKLSKLFADAIPMQISALRVPFDYAVARGIRTVVLLGDVAHYPYLSKEASFAFFMLLAEYDTRLDIHIITGNHDYERQGVDSLGFFRLMADAKRLNVSLYAEPTHTVINDVPVCFLPHPHTSPNTKTPSLCFGHFTRPNTLRDNGSVSKKGVVQDAKDMRHVYVIGHLHTHQISGNNYYPGTLYQTSFGEKGPKGFGHFKCRVGDKKALEFKYKQIEVNPVFRLENVRVTKDTVLTNLPNVRYKPILDKDFIAGPNFYTENPSVLQDWKTDAHAEGEDSLIQSFNLEQGIKEWLTAAGLQDQFGTAKKLLERARKAAM